MWLSNISSDTYFSIQIYLRWHPQHLRQKSHRKVRRKALLNIRHLSLRQISLNIPQYHQLLDQQYRHLVNHHRVSRAVISMSNEPLPDLLPCFLLISVLNFLFVLKGPTKWTHPPQPCHCDCSSEDNNWNDWNWMAKASKAWYSKGSKGLFSKAGKSVKSGVSSCLTTLLPIPVSYIVF